MLKKLCIGAAALAGLAMVVPIHAGPPLICHHIPVKDGESLPWTQKTQEKDRAYNPANVVQDTLDLLKPEMPVLVRIETLRRATLYIDRDRAKAEALLGALMARALDAESSGKPDALSYFDAGYLVGCYRQTGTDTAFGPAVTKGEGASAIAGYAWITRAIALNPNRTDLEYGAALITAGQRAPEHERHLRRLVLAGIPTDPQARGVLEWLAQINGTTLEALQERFKVADAHKGE